MIKQILKKTVRFTEYSVMAYFFCKLKNSDKKLKDKAEIVGVKIDKITAKRYGEKKSEQMQCVLIQIILTFSNHLVNHLMSDMPQKLQNEIKDKQRVI